MKTLKKLILKSGICTIVLPAVLLTIPAEALGQNPTMVDTKLHNKIINGQFNHGQDPTVVDARHYKVEFENDQVRVLRISYAPGEESVMHEHPNGVAVFLTSSKTEMKLGDGTIIEDIGKSGEAIWAPAGKHLPKEIGDSRSELILVELKSQQE